MIRKDFLPALRRRLLWILRTLSDPEYQQETWVRHNYLSDAEYNSFWTADEFLLDELEWFVKDPDSGIGVFLYDASEATMLMQVISAFEKVLETHGYRELTEAEYIAKPEWETVVTLAACAYNNFVVNNKANEVPDALDEKGWPVFSDVL